MEEAKEELEAALLQAKNQCIAIQQQVWDHDKHNLLQGEDIYVKRFLYAVTVARRTRFYNGYRPSDVPRSKSLTRIFMEQRYHRSKSLPPSLQRQDRSEPKMALTDSSDGVSTKIELTETVEESTLRDLIKNDLDECGHLARKLPPAKKNWEHVHDVHLQVSDNISQKGAIFRMGEHLYGFDTIRDLSFQAADQIDKFFGRKPHGTLLYQSPYHFLHDYIEDYGRGFFKSSLSRSAQDLSEWRSQHLESPRIDSPLSLSEVPLDSTETVRPGAYSDIFESRRPHNDILTSTASWASSHRRRDRGEHDAAHWDSISDRATHPSKQPFSHLSTARSFGTSSMLHLPSSVYADHNAMNSSNLLHNYFSSLHSLERNGIQQAFECNHHLVRDFREGSTHGTVYLLCDADVLPIAPGLQSEGSIRSMTSSRHSTADPLFSDQELSEMRSPFSTYSSKDLQRNKATGGSHIRDLFQQRTTHSDTEGYRRTGVLDGVYEPHYDPYASDRGPSTGKEYPGISLDNTISHLGASEPMGHDQGSKRGSEVSEADTLLAQSLDSGSEATLVQEDIHFPEVETLSPAAELEESHLHEHVTSVPSLRYDEQHPTKRNEEAELLLRDVHTTHRALQEQIDKYENAAWNRDTSHKEPIYDTVAADPKHIYDAVYNQEKKDIHHAHGAIVLSEPVQRPLAVSPPLYDEVADQRHPVEELHYAETELSRGALYDDDENIYEEIRDVPKPSQEVNTTQRHDYDVKELHYGVHPEREKLTSDINSNVDKDHRAVVDNMMNADIELHRKYPHKKDLSERKQTPYHTSDTVRAELVHLDLDDDVREKQYGGRINRELGVEHQIIRGQDEKKRFSAEENKGSTEVYNTAKPIPSPTFQRLQHIYTPEDVNTTGVDVGRRHGNRDYDMNKYEEPDASELPKGQFDKETALATVAIRRMSKTNQWTDDEDDVGGYDRDRALPLVSPRISSPRAFSPSTGTKWTPTATPPSLVKSNVAEPRVSPKHAYHEHSYEKRVSRDQKENAARVAATFDERRYQGLNPSKSMDNLSSRSTSSFSPSFSKNKSPFSPISSSTHQLYYPKTTEKVEEHLVRAEDVGFTPLSREGASIGQGAVTTTPRQAPTPPATPATPTVRRGFVLEMAKKYEQEHPEGSGKSPSFVKPARRKSEWNHQKQSAATVTPVVPAPVVPAPRTMPPREPTSSKVSVQEAVYAIERSTTGQPHSTAMDDPSEAYDAYSRERMISMGTKESLNLDEVTLPRWSPRNTTPSL
ncbi:hypothetical protein Y032_0301g1840 [Ancylostoma ceylanicum]|uniref:Uncharacterized protein n=1 Tax=Ancylostoma ceylanicum TaxID=53326 RepID=A0A016S3S3_9BILA|nr:hypothetical protein Y032_0301g1840 [Ancylostoma ceylanicum]EYB85303.1 hypothetical protein Y032_0301g1840 [Ancylostoma ceylanicum]